MAIPQQHLNHYCKNEHKSELVLFCKAVAPRASRLTHVFRVDTCVYIYIIHNIVLLVVRCIIYIYVYIVCYRIGHHINEASMISYKPIYNIIQYSILEYDII